MDDLKTIEAPGHLTLYSPGADSKNCQQQKGDADNAL